MARLQLSYAPRTELEKSATKKLRREGGIPATVYGKGKESSSIAVAEQDISAILKDPEGRLAVIDLKVQGKKSSQSVMIKEIQRHPITRSIVHIDFHAIALDEPVHAAVPVVLVGEAPGIKQGGMLEQITSEVEIRALPTEMPSHINVDISGLNVGDAILVQDLMLPETAQLVSIHPDAIVAHVRMLHIHAEEAAPAAEAAEEEAAPEAAGAPAEAPAE